MGRRTQHTSETKVKVVLEVLQEEQTVNEIYARYGVYAAFFLSVVIDFSRCEHVVKAHIRPMPSRPAQNWSSS